MKYWLSHKNHNDIVRHIVSNPRINKGSRALCNRIIYVNGNTGYTTNFTLDELEGLGFIPYSSICKNCLKTLPIDHLEKLRYDFVMRKLNK